MVIDTSAVLAILQGEPEAGTFIQSIEAADALSMSVGSFIETSIVIESRFGADGVRDLDCVPPTAPRRPESESFS